MYIRDYKGDMIIIDLSKLNNDKDKYCLLWRLKYNIDLKKTDEFNESLINFINGNNIFE